MIHSRSHRLAPILAILFVTGCASPVSPSNAPASPLPTDPGPSPSLATPTASPTPIATNPPAAAAGGFTWRRVAAPAVGPFTTVIADGTGFLAVAQDYSNEATDYAPTFWRSTNGLSWRQLHLTSAAPFIPDEPDRYFYTVTSMAKRGSTLVAVGERLLLDASAADAAMWYSLDDGTTWHRSAAGAPFADAAVYSVAANARGFVAVGSNGYPGASTQDTGTRGAAVWTSIDGRHWSRSPAQLAFAGGFMTQVIASPGGFVAAGTVHGGEAAPGAIPAPPIWTSSDGRTWHRTAPSSALGQADGVTVTAIPGGYVATGSVLDPVTGSYVGSAWWSRTGLSWGRAQITRPGYVSTVVSFGSTVLILGTAPPASGSADNLGVWTSPNGRSWHALTTIDSFRSGSIRAAAVNRGRLVIVGENTDPALTSPAGLVWVAVRG